MSLLVFLMLLQLLELLCHLFLMFWPYDQFCRKRSVVFFNLLVCEIKLTVEKNDFPSPSAHLVKNVLS